MPFTTTAKPGSASTSANAAAKPLKKKRTFPWDLMEPPAGKRPRQQVAPEKGAFHKLSGLGASADALDVPADSRSRSASPALTSEHVQIDQKLRLSTEQQKVLKLVVDEGKSVFFTGSAGEPLALVFLLLQVN